MQKSFRMNDIQLLALAEKAIKENVPRGYLQSRLLDSNKEKWQTRYYLLYQNLLFYYENDQCIRPLGVIFLEGSYCEKSVHTSGKPNTKLCCFTITYRKEKSKQFEFKAETEAQCNAWVATINACRFSEMLLQREELEQKHIHLVQIVENLNLQKLQYTSQCEELTMEIKKLRNEMCTLKRKWRLTPQQSISTDDETDEIRKVKKVQSFFRGWMCRRRWKQIVAEYINSPHAENMRKRNSLVFRMVEAEEEYVEQLHLLISCFLRPFKMAASSQKPPCTHDEVNSIFLNSETIMFLHQIFLKGLSSRMENWPTLVLGDLFDMLLPMLVIYQEYVRNHHFSLQVLAECKQKEKFNSILRRLEEKAVLQQRSLETFLTYPMHQVPRYIVTLHELLAHTPHNHVERKSLELAKSKLEELSRQMHDEVSETENIRKNLAIERIIEGGCDILLDVNQVFVRQGSVIQVLSNSSNTASNSLNTMSFSSTIGLRIQRSRFGSFRSGDKEVVRQCFLFTNHMLLCNRDSNGKLNMIEDIGRIPLNETTLIEDTSDSQFQFNVDVLQQAPPTTSNNTDLYTQQTIFLPTGQSNQNATGKDYNGQDFKLIWDCKTGPVTIHLVAPTKQDKAAWISDISQGLIKKLLAIKNFTESEKEKA